MKRLNCRLTNKQLYVMLDRLNRKDLWALAKKLEVNPSPTNRITIKRILAGFPSIVTHYEDGKFTITLEKGLNDILREESGRIAGLVAKSLTKKSAYSGMIQPAKWPENLDSLLKKDANRLKRKIKKQEKQSNEFWYGILSQ